MNLTSNLTVATHKGLILLCQEHYMPYCVTNKMDSIYNSSDISYNIILNTKLHDKSIDYTIAFAM